jgi:drug/metabolite transporter (DMT)-like permease
VVAVALVARQSLRVSRPGLPLAVAITGVLASLYPLSTVLLAQVVPRERLARAQMAGLGAAAAAVVLITLPG